VFDNDKHCFIVGIFNDATFFSIIIDLKSIHAGYNNGFDYAFHNLSGKISSDSEINQLIL